jgi:uncharacterized membrane protein (UPF0127 family)
VKYFKTITLLLFAVLVLIGGFFIRGYFSSNKESKEITTSVYSSTFTLSNSVFHVDVAETADKLMMGLSGRKSLGESEGLLFKFPQIGKYGFWMKDMFFPIDILWFTSDKRLVAVSEWVLPESYPEAFYPPVEIQYVLELPAGTFSKSNLLIGDIFSLESEMEL